MPLSSSQRRRRTAEDTSTKGSPRPSLRSVALPKEHGGWGLTFEPVLLGLLLAPSIAGALIGLATVFAFLARTPMRLLLVDHHRDRWLARSRLAGIVLVIEASILIGLVVGATWLAGWTWWVPVVCALPLVAVESWYDARSKSRLLVPELCGALGVAAASPAIVLAAGADRSLAVGSWLVLSARVVGSIPFVREQIVNLRTGAGAVGPVRAAQIVSIAIGAVALLVDRRFAAGGVAIVLLAGYQMAVARSTPPSATRLGITQMVLGLAVVLVTAVGVTLA